MIQCRQLFIWIFAGLVGVIGCNLNLQASAVTGTPIHITINLPSGMPVTPIEPPSIFTDASFLLDSVCYDALLSVTGQHFLLRNQIELTQFFNQLNTQGLCEVSLTSPQFDFSHQMVVMAFEAVQGCDAAFTPMIMEATFTAQIILDFQVQAGCNYELVASFVGATERLNYETITITVNH